MAKFEAGADAGTIVCVAEREGVYLVRGAGVRCACHVIHDGVWYYAGELAPDGVIAIPAKSTDSILLQAGEGLDPNSFSIKCFADVTSLFQPSQAADVSWIVNLLTKIVIACSGVVILKKVLTPQH